MQQTKTAENLRTAILELKTKRIREERMLKEQFHQICDSLKPINLIKNSVKEVVTSPELQDKVIITVVGLTMGHLSKLLFQRISDSPYKVLIGTAIQFGVTNAIVNKSEVVKKIGLVLYTMLRSKSVRKHTIIDYNDTE